MATSAHLKKTEKLVREVIGKGEAGGKADKMLELYIQQFYKHAPAELFAEEAADRLYIAARRHWEFISVRPAAAPRKVRVFNPSKERDGWESERTVVETCTTDSPFILDSITAELTGRGYTIYQVMHPIISVTRDSAGKIIALHDPEGGEERPAGSVRESVMHFEITHISEGKELANLEHAVDTVLHFVNLAVSDWRTMTAKAREITAGIGAEKLPFAKPYVQEAKDFLEWALDNHFIFLGYREYDFYDAKGKPHLATVPGSELGIFRAEARDAKPLGLTGIPPRNLDFLTNPQLLDITKSGKKSVVHRPVHMDYISVKKFGKDGRAIGEHRLLGLFTSSVYYQSARLIPIIRRKIDAVVKRSGFAPDSHNGKTLVTVLEGYPRDELLQITEDELFDIGMGIVSLTERPATKLFVRKDRFSRFVSCIVFIPRDRFNTQTRNKTQAVLEQAFHGAVTDYYIQVSESPLARVHFLMKLDIESGRPEPDLKAVEEKLVEITSSWNQGLRDTLTRHLGEKAGEKLHLQYVNAFPESFKDTFHFGGTYRDVLKMEAACDNSDLTLDLYQHGKDPDDTYQLKLYYPERLVTLSDVMPILENMGFNAVDEHTFRVQPAHRNAPVWVHHFNLRVSRATLFESRKQGSPLTQVKEEFEEALVKVWRREIESDALNKLILRARMKWRDVILLRAYCKYIRQTAFPYAYEYAASAIARLPELAQLLVQLFYAKFDPAYPEQERAAWCAQLAGAVEQELAAVQNIAEDRVIRQVFETVQATLRTNYFQLGADGKHKPYISFKLNSKKVPNLPLPRPNVEIWVYGRDVEGVHLRGGKVARGGLRWSDRHQDFRTEILGLVKAQMVKNAVIVPVGSKGGFVVKYPVEGGRDEVLAQGQECYRTYLRGLLDITDNIVDGKIVPPREVVRHDDDDPYLVVAADKGTAAFSDIANGVAESYGFWLGDAFASGGSAGYDHKKMAITARGGWVSVARHFHEMGVDITKQDFTVAGVGDMSGDVFGNGMLLSDHIRLAGAFNHQHIFIDPEPDAKAGFAERQRLFDKPRSSWADYDAKLISPGGGVFERAAKFIPVSKQMKQRFSIAEDKIAPDELIKKILTAPVDLLWNGGIGTYVKAESEGHEQAGDKTNDAVRVNGKDLRCKVVGEGGNLGFTQRGRIEYALAGGRINTDAIDNSGGVDCSDHEVNIKIALRKAMDGGKLPLKQRNELLAAMTEEVAHLVLRDNELQTLALTVEQQRGAALLEQKARLMRSLEEKGLLNRKIEFLPENDALAARAGAKQGLTRPELAVLLAYSKIDMYSDLLASQVADDPYMAGDLMRYFPAAMQKKFRAEIEGHELRREIICTVLANSIGNRMGVSFFQRVREETGMKGCDIARAYVITRDAFGLRGLWNEIEKESAIPVEIQVELYLETRRLAERCVMWLLRNFPQTLDMAVLVREFSPAIAELSSGLERIMGGAMREARDGRMQRYLAAGAPQALAEKIANLEALASACDIAHVAKQGTLPVATVGEIYYTLGERLGLRWLRGAVRQLGAHGYWQNLGVQTMLDTLFDQQMRLAAGVIQAACRDDVCTGALDAWTQANEKKLERYGNFIAELKRQENLDHWMLTVAVRKVEALG